MIEQRNVETDANVLAAPLELRCGVVLKNRLAKAAMSDSLGDGAGRPTDEQVELYRRWSTGGAALSLIGEVQVDYRYPEKPGNLVLWPGADNARLGRLADAGSIHGAQIWPQLGHAGALAHGPISRPAGPSAFDIDGLRCDALPQSAVDAMPLIYARGAGARYGGIATIDHKGVPQDFVTSGFTEEEHRNIIEWPDGPRLFAFFRDLPGPLRIPDVPAYIRSLGFAVDHLPSKSFLGTPMRHQGVHVGNFYLVAKRGGKPFTDADEEMLVVFAAQAAAAIAHARTYRDERRTRADLEALIETSPVGVVVFDAATGEAVSLNREARRIVDSLRTPGHTAESLLQTIAFRRADGSDVSLAELPLATVLSDAETVRAEEIEVSVPDGRSITTLINATPIRGEEGGLVSVIVTMQDLAPLQELERMRARFLGMVSHELRAPLTSIKGSAATVLRRSRNFGPEEIDQFFRIIEDQADRWTA